MNNEEIAEKDNRIRYLEKSNNQLRIEYETLNEKFEA